MSIERYPPPYQQVNALNFVTALPDPNVTRECVYTDSLSAPTYRWHLLYNGSSASSYKWEAIGGSPMHTAPNDDATANTITSSSYAALPSDPTSLTLPLAGDYDIEIGMRSDAAVSGQIWMTVKLGSATAVDSDAITQRNNDWTSDFRRMRRTGLAASAVLALQAKYVSVANGRIFEVSLSVMPARVG